MSPSTAAIGQAGTGRSGTSRRSRWVVALGVTVGAALAGVPVAGPAEATSPGQNGKIYFQQDGSIFSLAPTGAVKKVVPATKFSGLVEGVPSPDGRRLAFSSVRGGSDLFVKNLRTGTYKNVTGRASDELTLTSIQFPAWSPNGKQLVFQATRQQRSRLYRINADGTGIKQLQRFGDLVSGDLSPDWSSTGTIVFAYQGELWTIEPDGSGLEQVTVEDPAFDAGFKLPSWSPDGTQIAAEYDGDTWADGGVVIVTPDPGPGQSRYSHLTGNEDHAHSEVIEDPAWSPDGNSIVYYGHWAPWPADFADYDLWKVDVANPGTPVDLDAREQFGTDVYHPNWASQPR